MNYRHAYHAGNFADVMKHAVLALVLTYLNRKDTPYRVIDTHAGVGLYDLTEDKADRTGEWRGGIGRLLGADLPAEAKALLQPYLDVVAEVRSDLGATFYPGSPEIVRRLTRREDRLIAIEKHPVDVVALEKAVGGDRRAKVIALDGWTALKAYVPPREKRGLVLVDPPFEDAGEFERMGRAVAEAWRKWSTGVFMLWYPIKGEDDAQPLRRLLGEAGIAKTLTLELALRPAADITRLRGSGLVLINPPWTLDAEARVLLPALASVLGDGGRGQWRVSAGSPARI